MPKTIEGIYRNRKIELSETPNDVCEGTHVVVTILPPSSIYLPEHGIDKAQAADMRTRLASFAEDWESSEMDIYDNYDNPSCY